MARALAMILAVVLAASRGRATPPLEPVPYDVSRALREMWDPALLEVENDPPRRTLLLSSAQSTDPGGRGGHARQEPGERVLFEILAPGVMTRFTSADSRGTYRFYVDGASVPSWECEAWRLFTPGRSPVMPEFVGQSGSGGTIHTPILFSRSLKVTGIDGAGDRWLAVVSAFAAFQQVRPWTPMSDDRPFDFADEMERARRAWRGEGPPPRDPRIARIEAGTPWTAAADTLVTGISGTGAAAMLELPANSGPAKVPTHALFPGGRWGDVFEVPFLVRSGESIRVDAGGAVVLRGRTVPEQVARSAPRLLFLRDDGRGKWGAHGEERLLGVGRVLRMAATCSREAATVPLLWGFDAELLYSGFDVPGLGDLAGVLSHATAADTTGTLALGGDWRDPARFGLRCDFPAGGLPFARAIGGIVPSRRVGRDFEVMWIGQVFPGPPVAISRAGEPTGDVDERIRFWPQYLDSGLPRPLSLGGCSGFTSPPKDKLTDGEEGLRVRQLRLAGGLAERRHGEAIARWTGDPANVPEMRLEDDGSVVLDLPEGFEPRPGDGLWLDLPDRPPRLAVTATFEPHSGNEAPPVFPARFARDRGTNGVVHATARKYLRGGELLVPIGNNASWPGGRRDRIVLRATSEGEPVALLARGAVLERGLPRPAAPGTRWMPLLWDAKERVFGMYPATQVELRGQSLYDVLNPRTWVAQTQLYPEWLPQLRLEHIAAAPFGPRVALPADPGPRPDEEVAFVFSASEAGESMELRHPALHGATALAVRFGNSPDAARVAIRDAALRVVACEDLFLTDRFLPGRILAIELPEPNPGDFITFESWGPAPGSSGAVIIIERVLIDGPPGLRTIQPAVPRKPSRVLNPEPPRRPF